MDSGGNSGSMQSTSTGGDEEYDSRADPTSSFSAFLNSNQSPFSTTHHHVFNPLSNYHLDPTQRPQSHNQILNHDMVWSKVSPRSLPDLTSFMPSSSPHNNQAFLLTQLGGGTVNNNNNNVGAFPTSSLPPESASPIEGGGVLVNEQANSGVRNPKKRSRASRRAPTTVLTTDTTNFRAMVQEFTGIPAPPFTSSSFPRSRLDLFASNSNASSAPTQTQTQTPPYLLRPFAHKVQAQPSSIPPSSSFPPIFNNNNYHSLNLNMHNPILSFHSILQPHPLGNNNNNSNNSSSSVLVASKTTQQQQQQPSLEIPPSAALDSSHLKMGGLEELGLSHAHVAHQQQQQNINNMVSSDVALSRVNNMRGPSSSTDWAQRIGNNNDGYRSINVSDIHGGDKGPECAVAARSEDELENGSIDEFAL